MSDERISEEPVSIDETKAPEADAGQGGDQSPEAQVADLRDKLLRAMAEAENTRRRAEKEKQEAAKYGITKFARDLLSVSDNLQRAIAAVPEEEKAQASEVVRNLIAGVEMIDKELAGLYERYGIRKIDSVGEKFNPNRHQAVAEVPGTGIADGCVAEVFQVGYVFEDRLLRPAMVTVARGGPLPGQEPGGEVDTSA